MTITNLQDDLAYFDLSPETNNVCELLKVDKLNNLERAIKYNDMINGTILPVMLIQLFHLKKLSQFPIITF